VLYKFTFFSLLLLGKCTPRPTQIGSVSRVWTQSPDDFQNTKIDLWVEFSRTSN